MITQKQILAEIKNRLKTYDQQGLLDDISLRAWIKECILEFAGDVTEENRMVLRVEKGRAQLPNNFWSLKAAVKCSAAAYDQVKNKKKKHAQRKISYLEWTEIKDYYNWLEGKPCKKDCDTKYITETLYVETPENVYTVYYDTPKMLSLIPHVYEIRCEADCPNLTQKSEYEISIDERHNQITTNFNDGHVWLWYRGLPSDDEGNLVVPKTSKDKLKNYIIYFTIVRTLQDMLLSGDDPNVIQKLNVFQPLMNEYYDAAWSESVSKGLMGWQTRLINNNRRELAKYENMFRSLTPGHPYGKIL